MLHGYLLDGAAQSGDAGRLIVAGNEVIYFLAMFFFFYLQELVNMIAYKCASLVGLMLDIKLL